MIITCPQCKTNYSFDKSNLVKSRNRVKCFNCNHIWSPNLDIKEKNDLDKKRIKPIEKKKTEEEFILNQFPDIDESKKKGSFNKILIFVFFLCIFVGIYSFKDLIEKYFLEIINKNSFTISKTDKSKDLIFNNIQKEIDILNDDKKIIKIYGKISNASNVNKYKIPRLRAALLDDRNNIITSWFFYAEKDKLLPEETTEFNTSYIHNKENILDIKIEFYPEQNE